MALHSELRGDHMTCNVHHDVMCIVISGFRMAIYRQSYIQATQLYMKSCGFESHVDIVRECTHTTPQYTV